MHFTCLFSSRSSKELTYAHLQKWSPRLLQRIRQRNLLLRIGSFGWETELFNGYISTFALRWRKYVQMWFSAGAALGLACMVITVLFLMPGYLISRITSSGEQSSVQLQLIVRIESCFVDSNCPCADHFLFAF